MDVLFDGSALLGFVPGLPHASRSGVDPVLTF